MQRSELVRLVAWIAVRRPLIIALVVALGGAALMLAGAGAAPVVTGIARAAGGDTVTITLTPNKVSAPSGLSISATGLSGAGSGLPTSIEVLLQPGFVASAKSVPVLCPASQASSDTCPAGSQIGTGSVGATFLGTPVTVPTKLYLGDPPQAGDIASVILSGSYSGSSLTVSGRLFVPAQGGLELLFSSFPSVPVTLDSVSMSVQASRTATRIIKRTVIKFVTRGKGKHKRKHKVKKKVRKTIKTTYSLITNPSSCTGAWTGTATFNFPSGLVSLPSSAPCTP